MKSQQKLIDPICGMSVNAETAHKLVHGTDTIYFCSRHCLDRYAKENNVSGDVCATGPVSQRPLILNKNILTIFILVILMGLSYACCISPRQSMGQSADYTYAFRFFWIQGALHYFRGFDDRVQYRHFISILGKTRNDRIESQYLDPT